MLKDQRAVRLTASDYLASDRKGLNQQVASARWQLMLTVQRLVPEFFERLRDDVYPAFAPLADQQPDYWRTGYEFAMWQSRSDADRRLTPILTKWAGRFSVEEEKWILEGALQTLSNWHKFPRCREALEILGFRKPVCATVVVSDPEPSFHFDDDGWDPTLISFAGWRANIRERFEAAVGQHRQQMLARVKERGGLPAAVRASGEHFDWLALYHFGNASFKSILARVGYGDNSTISKGIHQAAELARLQVRAKRRKLKSR